MSFFELIAYKEIERFSRTKDRRYRIFYIVRNFVCQSTPKLKRSASILNLRFKILDLAGARSSIFYCTQ